MRRSRYIKYTILRSSLLGEAALQKYNLLLLSTFGGRVSRLHLDQLPVDTSGQERLDETPALAEEAGGGLGLGARGEARFTPDDLAEFAAGLEHYRARRWDDAERAMRDFLSKHPGDGPAEVLAARVAELRSSPPPESWDGAFEQLVK